MTPLIAICLAVLSVTLELYIVFTVEANIKRRKEKKRLNNYVANKLTDPMWGVIYTPPAEYRELYAHDMIDREELDQLAALAAILEDR